MATTLQFRRGTTAELSSVTGAEAELFVDTDKKTVVVMDGATAGGIPLAKSADLPTDVSDLTDTTNLLFDGAYSSLSGTPTIPTNVSDLTNDSGFQTASDVSTAIANLVDSAPSTLDTLNELAAALGDDANFATTVTTALSGKQETLVSGTNIKTINSESILGSGDIVIAAGGGSGLFNTAINTSVGYAVTTTMATAVTFASDAIVHSILITNINSGASITVDGDFIPTGGSAIGMFLGLPMPIGSSLEVLKKPQVVNSGDVIQLKASASSSAYATIVYETTDSTDYERSSALAQLDSATTLYTSTGNPSVVESIKVANVDSSAGDHAITVTWTDSSDTIKSYISSTLIVPAGSTIELSENQIFMSTGDKIVIQSTYNDKLSVFLSAKLITG